MFVFVVGNVISDIYGDYGLDYSGVWLREGWLGQYSYLGCWSSLFYNCVAVGNGNLDWVSLDCDWGWRIDCPKVCYWSSITYASYLWLFWHQFVYSLWCNHTPHSWLNDHLLSWYRLAMLDLNINSSKLFSLNLPKIGSWDKFSINWDISWTFLL